MAFDIKAATPDTSFGSGAYLFGADSQSATDPSIYAQSTVWDYWKTLANTWSANSALSAPADAYTGTWVTGGTATTTKPHLLIEPTGTTSTGWSTSGTGFGVNAAAGFVGSLLDLQSNGTPRMRVTGGGDNILGPLYVLSGGFTALYTTAANAMSATTTARAGIISHSATAGYVLMNANAFIGFGSAGSGTDVFGTQDTTLYRDAANTLALRNSTNAQTFRSYETFTDFSNYSRLNIYYNSAVFAGFVLESEAAGTGTYRRIALSGERIQFQTGSTFAGKAIRWTIANDGHFLAQADNTYDIGASGASRPRNIYAGGNISAASELGGLYLQVSSSGMVMTNRGRVNSPSDGVWTLLNAAQNDWGRLQFGGTTSSFPALKRSSTVLQARLADDSDFAPLQGKLRTEANAVAETPTATHTMIITDAGGTAYRVLCCV